MTKRLNRKCAKHRQVSLVLSALHANPAASVTLICLDPLCSRCSPCVWDERFDDFVFHHHAVTSGAERQWTLIVFKWDFCCLRLHRHKQEVRSVTYDNVLCIMVKLRGTTIGQIRAVVTESVLMVTSWIDDNWRILSNLSWEIFWSSGQQERHLVFVVAPLANVLDYRGN